ncbi:MAG: aminotransferase class IV [Armatimonadetes bacterium]|nr:aminotransferase class IV [Armatimonadota bacterium]
MPELAYINGETMPIEEAKVSIDDRGFQFGDGVYEVVRSYGGRLWALERHLARLQRSLESIGISGLAIDEVRDAVTGLYEQAEISDALMYFQVTRGVAPRQHTYSCGIVPTFLVTVRHHPEIRPSHFSRGVPIITLPECRWHRRDIKSTNLLPNVLAKQQAHAQGAYEAVFVEADHVTEGAGTNVFIAQGGGLITAPAGTHILHGITRQLVLETARRKGLSCEEEYFSQASLQSADEVFLAGTSIGIMPVTRVDGAPVGCGQVGKMTAQLMEYYQDRIDRRDD